MATGPGRNAGSRRNSDKDQSDARHPFSNDTKSTGLPSPRGPRPVKHSPTNEKGPIQVMKAATDPTSGYYAERWTNTQTVTLPAEYTLPNPGPLPSLKPMRQAASFEPMRAGTPTNVSSAVPSSKLWDNLRHHVLTPPVRPSTPSRTVLTLRDAKTISFSKAWVQATC
jgi:hypothetical protein